MFRNGRKTICIFVAEVDTEYIAMFVKGAVKRFKALGYNVACMTNFNGYGQEAYSKGEGFIIDLPDLSEFDGIILSTDTMYMPGFEEKIEEQVALLPNCPVVSVRRRLDCYKNVLVNNDLILEDVIKHFIEVHNFTRICFLAGPRGHLDSEKRLDCFYRVMKEHRIPVSEDQIYYGDFWFKKTEAAVNYFFRDGKEQPQAIVCANDYMAIEVCNQLLDRGIRVPEDVCVSGCDDLSMSAIYRPSLTSAGASGVELGEKVAEVMNDLVCGRPVEQDTYVNTHTSYRESCGCNKRRMIENNSIGRIYMNESGAMRLAYRANSAMSNMLTGLASVEEMFESLRYYIFENRGYESFHMFLCDDWWKMDRENKLSDQVMHVFSAYSDDRMDTEETVFQKNRLLPDKLITEEPFAYLFNILHHRERVFGYVAISFQDDGGYASSYEGWLVTLGNAVENVRTTIEMKRLMYELTRTYTVDALTDLYNRRGLSVLSNQMLSSPEAEQKKLMVICADMDDLKAVNDNFGHANGDIAIRAIADCLRTAATKDEICARTGGDEFTVVGLVDSEKDVKKFVDAFECAVKEFNVSQQLPWTLNVSYGWHVMSTDGIKDIEEGMTIADAHLYKQKAMNKARRLVESLEGKRTKSPVKTSPKPE